MNTCRRCKVTFERANQYVPGSLCMACWAYWLAERKIPDWKRGR